MTFNFEFKHKNYTNLGIKMKKDSMNDKADLLGRNRDL